jgi:hypothetical protein
MITNAPCAAVIMTAKVTTMMTNAPAAKAEGTLYVFQNCSSNLVEGLSALTDFVGEKFPFELHVDQRTVLTVARADVLSAALNTNVTLEVVKTPERYTWKSGETTLAKVDLATNVFTHWLPLEQLSQAEVRRVGYLATNRVLVIIHDGQTNEFVLKLIGREEFPSQKGTNAVEQLPRPGR